MQHQVHRLKILKGYADAKIAGDKLFEIRYDGDRAFQKGDIVIYEEVINNPPDSSQEVYIFPIHSIYSKQYRITFVTSFQQKKGYVVFGEEELSESEFINTDAYTILGGEEEASDDDDEKSSGPVECIGFRDKIQPEIKSQGGFTPIMKSKNQSRILYLAYDFNMPSAGIYLASNDDSETFPEVPKDYDLGKHEPILVKEGGGEQYYVYIYAENETDKIIDAIEALQAVVYDEFDRINLIFYKDCCDISGKVCKR